jgi:deoxyhypusine synthase
MGIAPDEAVEAMTKEPFGGALEKQQQSSQTLFLSNDDSTSKNDVGCSKVPTVDPSNRCNNILESKPLSKNNAVSSMPHIPSISASAVLGESLSMPKDVPICRGVDFSLFGPKKKNDDNDNDDDQQKQKEEEQDFLSTLMQSLRYTGFQATNMGLAVEQIQRMRSWRLSHVPWQSGVDDPDLQSMEVREKIRARIFLAYTSNQISSGQREVIRFLVQHKMVDVIVTTAGGIEEDLIKCLQPTYLGDFQLDGRELRQKGINRIGNLLIPNKNYCEFEDWGTPLIEAMHQEQDEQWAKWAMEYYTHRQQQQQQQQMASGSHNDKDDDNDTNHQRFVWTPSKFIRRLGLEIQNEESVLYWAARNDIPVFCPALTDGSIGDILYFHSYKRPGLVLDIGEDVRAINDLAIHSHATGMIILGGGLVKHHTCNANLMRNGADFSVYINTGQEFDGSDSGASPDEAISWGKIRLTAEPVKVCCDATIAFPLIVSQTFAKDVDQWKKDVHETVCYVDDALQLLQTEKGQSN